jgi:hypothetical protein
MKESAAEAIADAVAASKLDNENAMLLNVLHSMGRHAAPAVPKLIEMLEGTSNALLAHLILQTLESCGPAADKALPCIIRCLLRFDYADIYDGVKNVLRLRFPASLDVLRDAISNASGADRSKLQGISNELGFRSDPNPAGFSSLPKVKMVQRFIAIGQMLTSGSFSQRGLSELLESKVAADELPEVGYSVQSIIRALGEVQKHFGGKAIVDTGEDGLMTLTAHGQAVLEQCRKR